MSWKVIRGDTGKVVEEHPTPRAAERAMMILSAHDLKNGRVAHYNIEPLIFIPSKIDELNLPSWALEALEIV